MNLTTPGTAASAGPTTACPHVMERTSWVGPGDRASGRHRRLHPPRRRQRPRPGTAGADCAGRRAAPGPAGGGLTSPSNWSVSDDRRVHGQRRRHGRVRQPGLRGDRAGRTRPTRRGSPSSSSGAGTRSTFTATPRKWPISSPMVRSGCDRRRRAESFREVRDAVRDMRGRSRTRPAPSPGM